MNNPFLDNVRFPGQTVLKETANCLCLFSSKDSLHNSVLIVPKIHRETPFDLTEIEWMETKELLAFARQHLTQYQPDGFNIGWNCKPCAGQSIPWAHLHVIPRFADEIYAGRGIRWLFKQPENQRGKIEPCVPANPLQH